MLSMEEILHHPTKWRDQYGNSFGKFLPADGPCPSALFKRLCVGAPVPTHLSAPSERPVRATCPSALRASDPAIRGPSLCEGNRPNARSSSRIAAEHGLATLFEHPVQAFQARALPVPWSRPALSALSAFRPAFLPRTAPHPTPESII